MLSPLPEKKKPATLGFGVSGISMLSKLRRKLLGRTLD
jgi:hypothetical protein